MPDLFLPRALYQDWQAMRASMRLRHLPLRLPEQPPGVEAFWANLHVAAGPVPDLGAALTALERGPAGEVARYAFPSRVTTPHAENNVVVGRVYTPLAPAEDGPFLLLLHANGREDFTFDDVYARRLMARGWRVALMALPYHMQRRPAHLDPGAGVMTPDLPHTLTALGQAVSDAADVLRWARAEGVGRVGVAGWSLGGLVAALVTTQLPLDRALLVEPAVSLPWMMSRSGLFPVSVRRQLRAAGLSRAALERVLAPVLPINLRPQVPLKQLHILAARYDLLVGYAPVRALWAAWGRPRLTVQPTGHVALLFQPALGRALDEITRE
jgi:pimeloyl-ACP methyl ester carboxylesterase